MDMSLMGLWNQMGGFAKGIVVTMALMSIYSLTIMVQKWWSLRIAQKETRKEKGCLTYDLNRDAKGGQYTVYERWKDLAGLEAHLASDHIKALFGELGAVLDGQPETKILVPVGE